jgi:oligopeptide/dipeptide ABC transporter ATP-binding protein
MIFQDPMTSLNPYLTVEEQLAEVGQLHLGLDRKAAVARAVALLDRVGIPAAGERIRSYPHEFSGGMRQRAMIAMALLCDPEILIADEPTTALDVTIQAQILDLLQELRRERGMAIVFITHDLGVVAGTCDRILVMYAGRVVEEASTRDLYARPAHPYTLALLRSVPRVDGAAHGRLAHIEGRPPRLDRPFTACTFAPRCAFVREACHAGEPALVGS